MVDVKLIHNPYFLKTELLIDNVAVTSNSPLAFIFGKAMDKWLKPSCAWKGFFAELVEAVGNDKLKISFVGTAEDFDDLNAAIRPKSMELEYLLENAAQINSGAGQKLQALVDFLNAPIATGGKDFLAEVRPALTGILSDKVTVNVIAIAENFSVRNILPNVVDNSDLNFIVNATKQNLLFTLLKALGDVNKSMTLFVFDRAAISSAKVTAALQAVTQSVDQDEYAQAIYDGLFFVCNDTVAERDVKNILNACGFDKPKIFVVNGAFSDCREILSAADCKNFLHAPIPATLKNHYAERIARCREVAKECTRTLKFYALHTLDEIKDAERRRDDALNEIALINSNLPVLEQAVWNYAERHVLPATVRKIYLGVKKKLIDAERDTDKKISDANESLQSLRNRIADLSRNPAYENRREESFAATESLQFDSVKFGEMSREVINRLTTGKFPAAESVVEKNLVGRTENYLKLAAAQNYSQIVNVALKKFLRALVDDVAAQLAADILTPARNAVAQLPADDQNRVRNLIDTFAKIISEKNFDLPPMNFDLLALESYEATGRKYDFVKYVPVNEIFSAYREWGERLLKERLRKFKTAAANFVNDFQAQVTENFNRPTSTQNVTADELQRLQRAVDSKTKNLAAYKRELAALKNFGGQLNRLLEINP